MNNKIIGKEGEELAADFLRKDGYEIIERNFICGFGEIDIVARKENELAFVEVKTRAQSLYGIPSEAVNRIKQRHIYKVAEYYLYKTSAYNYEISFDVIEVYMYNGQAIRIEKIKNAIVENPEQTFRR